MEGDVTPGPVIAADGTIYAASNAGVLHALDPATGIDLWTFDGGGSYGADLSTSAAVLPDATILWPGPGGRLSALTPEGGLAWQVDLGGMVTSPAVTDDGEVALGTSSGLLVMFEPTEDRPGERWRVDLGETSYGSPVFSGDGDTVYQTTVSGVTAVRDGAVLWRQTAPEDLVEVSAAVAPDGTVTVGTNDPYQYGLSPDDGEVVWRYERRRTTYSSPSATRDGIVYFGDHNNTITGVDAASGERVFQYQGSRVDGGPGGIGIWTSILVDAEHSVYAGTRQGLVYGVDRDGGLLWSIDAETTVDSYPALAGDGALIIGVTDGRLLSIADD